MKKNKKLHKMNILHRNFGQLCFFSPFADRLVGVYN